MEKPEYYKKIISNKFKSLNVESDTADKVTDSLLRATCRGINSHGINLLYHYGKSVLSGRKNPNPKYSITSKYDLAKSLDADNTFGASAGYTAIEKIKSDVNKFGICSIGVFNSSHCASLSSIALQAVNNGMIFFGFTHADSLMKSPDSNRVLFGTNPLCIAAPSEEVESPICLDMATTKITWNKLKNYKSINKKLDHDYACDENGNVTNDPNLAKSLLPIGGYKGFAISAMVDFLCGPLLGMRFGLNIPSMYEYDMGKTRSLGQFYICMMPDFSMKMTEYYKNVNYFIEMIGSDNKSLYPGEKENKYERIVNKNGLKLNSIEENSLNKFLKL